MVTVFPSYGPFGQGWGQIGELLLAFGLSALIGFEREMRHKSAGIRTYTVVGIGSALFMLISKYGFMNVLTPGQVVLDPSRVAAQIVSGLGFIGAGIIFVRRDSVRGLTTAASVWLTAAIAASATAGLIVLAIVSTIVYFAAVLVLPPLAARVGARLVGEPPLLQVTYLDGRGILRQVLGIVTESGFRIKDIHTNRLDGDEPIVELTLYLSGRADHVPLARDLAEVDGIRKVITTPSDSED